MLLQSNANGTIGPALDSALLGRDSIMDSDRYRANAIHDSNNINYNYNVDNLTNIVESSLYHIFRCGSKRCQFQNKLIPVNNLLKENFTLIIFFFFFHFTLIGLEWDSITLFTKMNVFFLPKLTF